MRILLIEDSTKLVDNLRLGLTRVGFEVAAATNGELGLRMASCGNWDVVVLDLLLPGLPGLEVLRRLREKGSQVHVLVLTALGSVEERVRGLQAGADDYLGKPFSLDELVARVQAMTRRKHGQKSPVILVADLRIDTAGRSVSRSGVPVSLTNREYRLLELLAMREGQTVSRSDLEEHLYGSRSLPLSNVVDSAICSIRAKLKALGEGSLIHTRPRLGYVLSATAP
jgi:two-component system, OmpR family, response regulator